MMLPRTWHEAKSKIAAEAEMSSNQLGGKINKDARHQTYADLAKSCIGQIPYVIGFILGWLFCLVWVSKLF